MQRIRLAVARRLASAFAYADDRVGAVFTCLHPIASWLGNRKRQIRCIDLDDIVPVQPAHTKVDRTRCKLDLNRIVIQVQEREACIRVQANHSRSQLQFGTRVLVRPQLVARRHGPICDRLHPIRFAGRLE